MKNITLTEEQLSQAVALWCEKHYPVEQPTNIQIVFEVSNIRSGKPVIAAHVRKADD